jgi:hypothetical protein
MIIKEQKQPTTIMKNFFTAAENKDNVQKHVLLYTIL